MTAEEILTKIETDEELRTTFAEAFIADLANQTELLDAEVDANEILTIFQKAITMGGDAHELLAFLLGVGELEDWLVELL